MQFLITFFSVLFLFGETAGFLVVKPRGILIPLNQQHPRRATARTISLHLTPEDSTRDEDNQVDKNDAGFDGEGFAGYLLPYSLAFLASIAVTGAFVKFVLLDY